MKRVNIRHHLKLNEAFGIACRMIQEGDVEGLRSQLNQYPHLARWQDHADSQGSRGTLLHEASGRGMLEWPENAHLIAGTLIKAGATVCKPRNNQQQETPLHQAASVNNVPVTKVLLQAGADTEEPGRFDGTIDTALGYALFYGMNEKNQRFPINCPDILVKYGARVYLPFAAAMGYLSRVKSFFNPDHSLLPEAGLGKPELTLQQAFLFACQQGQIEVSEYLLYRGVDINARIPFFHHYATGLHLACESGQQKELVAFLLKNGANPTIKDGVYGADAKGWTMFNGQDEVFEVIMSLGTKRFTPPSNTPPDSTM